MFTRPLPVEKRRQKSLALGGRNAQASNTAKPGAAESVLAPARLGQPNKCASPNSEGSDTVFIIPNMSNTWTKVYVYSAKLRKNPPEDRHIRDVEWTEDINSGLYYDTREEAQGDVDLIFEGLIFIETAEGYKHRLTGFQVEELSPDKFVISVEGPFVRKPSSGSP